MSGLRLGNRRVYLRREEDRFMRTELVTDEVPASKRKPSDRECDDVLPAGHVFENTGTRPRTGW